MEEILMKKETEIEKINDILIELASVIQSGDYSRRYFDGNVEYDLIGWIKLRLK